MLKKFRYIILLFSFYSLFIACEEDFPSSQDLQVHDFVWKGLNAYYLHQGEVPDISDRRFNSDQQLESFLRNSGSPENLFSNLIIGSDIKSQLIEDYTQVNLPIQSRSSFTTGLEFGVFRNPSQRDSVIGYVLDVLPQSYASTQSITRGEFFSAIIDENNDTIRLAEDNYTDLLINYPQDTLKLITVDYDGITITPNNGQVALVRQAYQFPPIHLEKVFDFAPNRIGYLVYNNDFSRNYIQEINSAMSRFNNQSINQLIIDLRYNIGGGSFNQTVAEIAAMITGQFPNEVLIKETWNSKAQSWFEANQPDSLATNFPTTLIENSQNINSLNLSDVYIILNGNSFRGSSTLELLINSLRPYINVHVIGNNTRGNNTGTITLYDSPDYDFFNVNTNHVYALQPEVLTFSNFDDETYESGIFPTIQLCPIEDPLNLGELGEITDPILNRVLTYINTGVAGFNVPCNPLNFEVLYNSVNVQRIFDTGIFIEQDLPDLGR